MDTTEALAAGLGGLPSRFQGSWVIKVAGKVDEEYDPRNSGHVDWGD